jgi:hypothetical protein
MTPTVTARADGLRAAAPDGTPGRWRYDGASEVGGDVRWGLRQNLTANATVNPDFSQVEADIGQVTLNERFALFYPEKRPFFLDGLELFDSPNQLIYTRRVIEPDAGLKLAGKVANTNVATLVALDARSTSWTGDQRPFFGITRLRRDIGGAVTAGAVATAREDGADHSRLVGLDLRVTHSRMYWAQLQAVRSWTDSAGRGMNGSMVEAVWDRTGRAYGFHYSLQAVAPGLRAAAGFVNRTGILEASASNRFTAYGAPGQLLQQAQAFVNITRIADYDRPRDGSIEGSESISPSLTLRGGWRVSGNVSRGFVSYDPAMYSSYAVGAVGAPAPFVIPGPEENLFAGSLGVTTPTFRRFTASATAALGEVAIFREAAPGRSRRVDATIDLRPTTGLRTSVQLTSLSVDRARDGSAFSRELIPRLKVEYQLHRAVFVRVVGQYAKRSREPAVDRAGSPILIGGAPDAGDESGELQADWLFSYRPVPGTLFYFGYGATMRDAGEVRWTELPRSRDGFFLKASYLFRM